MAGEPLEALDDDVAVAGVELDQARTPPEAVAGDERRARAGEGVEHELAAPARVAHGDLDELGGLHRRMVARGRRAVDLEHRSLTVPAVPACSAAPEAPLAPPEAVENHFVAVVVVRAPHDERGLEPDEGLAEEPPLGEEGVGEGRTLCA